VHPLRDIQCLLPRVAYGYDGRFAGVGDFVRRNEPRCNDGLENTYPLQTRRSGPHSGGEPNRSTRLLVLPYTSPLVQTNTVPGFRGKRIEFLESYSTMEV